MKSVVEKRGELVYTLDEIEMVGAFFYDQLLDFRVLALTGTLGAGKTTLVQAILRQAGIKDTVQSPTFAYVHSYVTSSGYTFYHFDLYRTTNAQQFVQQGFMEYLAEAQAYTLIEWPEVVSALLPSHTAWVALDVINTTQRCARYELPEREERSRVA